MVVDHVVGPSRSQQQADVGPRLLHRLVYVHDPWARLAGTRGSGRQPRGPRVLVDQPVQARSPEHRATVVGGDRGGPTRREQPQAAMDQARYDAEMERLLTELAVKTKEIRDRQAKKQ